MLKGSGLWCLFLALEGCAHTPPPKDYGKAIDALVKRLEALETDVALMHATPKDDAFPGPGCPDEDDGE